MSLFVVPLVALGLIALACLALAVALMRGEDRRLRRDDAAPVDWFVVWLACVLGVVGLIVGAVIDLLGVPYP